MTKDKGWTVKRLQWAVIALGAVTVHGCSSTQYEDPEGEKPGGTLVGAFQVSLVPAAPATASADARQGYTSVFGKVFDGESPDLVIWEEAIQSGACRLLTLA